MYKRQQTLAKSTESQDFHSMFPILEMPASMQPVFNLHTPCLSSCWCANFLLKEGMPQRLRRRNPLFGVDSQAAVQQIMKLIEMLSLCLVHAARRNHEARAEVASWFDHGQDSDCCLQGQRNRSALREQKHFTVAMSPK